MFSVERGGVLMQITILVAALSCAALLPASACAQNAAPKIVELVKRDDVIWGFDFLNNSQVIFTEREGKMGVLSLDQKSVTEIRGLPEIWSSGQGGLLDVRVHPNFKANKTIFFTFSRKSAEGGVSTALASATLDGSTLGGLKTVFVSNCMESGGLHFGSRIEFDKSGLLFVSLGERGERNKSQDLKSHCGKLIRLKENGEAAPGNPFVESGDPFVWTYGHRNPQGLDMRPGTQELWSAEMGPRGGDEINLIKAGKNYGWPIATYGREYSGGRIGPQTAPGVENPIIHWVPSISPSAIHFYRGDKFPNWKGQLFVGNLSGQHLRRLELQGQKVVKEEKLLEDKGWRVRNIRTGPDGFLYLSIDQGKIVRLEPGSNR